MANRLVPLSGLKNAKPTADELPDDHEMFLPAEEGPFLCANCEYYTTPNQCSEQHMLAKYGEDGPGFTTANGEVSDGACCDFHHKRDEGQ